MDYIEVKTQGLWVTKGYVKYDGNRIIKKVCINIRFPRDMLMEIIFLWNYRPLLDTRGGVYFTASLLINRSCYWYCDSAIVGTV